MWQYVVPILVCLFFIYLTLQAILKEIKLGNQKEDARWKEVEEGKI